MLMLKDALWISGMEVTSYFDQPTRTHNFVVQDAFGQVLARKAFPVMGAMSLEVEVNHYLWSIIKQYNPEILEGKQQ